MVLPIEPRDPLRPGEGSDPATLRLLKDWYKQFNDTDKQTINHLSGYSMSLLDFPIPVGFFNALLSFWDHHRHVLRLGDRELMPSLEEYAYLSGFELSKSCAQVNPGVMLEPFLTLLNFKQEAIRPKLDQSYALPIAFLYDRFSDIQSFQKHIKEFQDNTKIEKWSIARVDAFLICLISQVFFPKGMVRFDIGVAKVVSEMKQGRSIVPLIVAESIRSLSTCRAHPGACFQGSFALLYIWTMGHLTPHPNARLPSYYFKRDISGSYRARPKCCTNQDDWEMFFTSVTAEDMILYTGWCSKSFLFKAPGYDFIPLVGLRGMMPYFSSAIATQFDRFQDIPALQGGGEFWCKITASKRRLLNIAYRSWEKLIISIPDSDESIEKFSKEYLLWLEDQRCNWENREGDSEESQVNDSYGAAHNLDQTFQQISFLTTRVDELQRQLLSVTSERDQAISRMQTLRNDVDVVAMHLRDQAPSGVDNTGVLDLLVWVHQSLGL